MGSWEHEASANLGRVIEAVIEAAMLKPSDRVVDLGCGSGQVTLVAAPKVHSVVGVDISQGMVDRLRERSEECGYANVDGMVTPLERLSFPAGSVDVVVSNYVLHHLSDANKETVVRAAYGWLQPGGRLVVGDMMFGRGGGARDRAVIAAKVRIFASRGVAGYWRIAKNAVRYLLRVQEKPVSAQRWVSMFTDAGFSDVHVVPVIQEAAVVVGQKPSTRS
ncbi:MAG: class I SAM-dependent methyltransferase [Ferrimicrobium sp.]